MIFDKISNLKLYEKVLPAPLIKGLQYLKETDIVKLESGKYEIDGENIFAMVQDYSTFPKEERRPEAHRKYIDIQYLAQGSEIIGYAPVRPDYQIAEDLLEEKDLLFYSRIHGETDLVLDEGMFAIFFPDEVHRPCCQNRAESYVKKVVIKVAKSLVD